MRPHVQPAEGFALLPLLLLLCSSLLLAIRLGWPAPAAETALQQLQRAKAALLARAMNDANRPGSLPCPDFVTEDAGLANFPGDGKADNLTRNDCPSYLGWLPWATLDLGEQRDRDGSPIWYALARNFRDDDNAPPLNPLTGSDLSLDGQGDVVALLIAPGAPLAGQSRPSRRAADYLEGSNADGDLQFASGPPTAAFNDIVVAITRQELIAAVEQRLANGVRRCLSQHAANSGQLPWPAPLGVVGQRGYAGSHFGQIPLTQPDLGPRRMLDTLAEAVQRAGQALPVQPDPRFDRNRLSATQDALLALRAFADQLHAVSAALALEASAVQGKLTQFDTLLRNAESNGRISVTERSTIRTQGEVLPDGLGGLLNRLADSGLDPYPLALASDQQAIQDRLERWLGSLGQPDLDALLGTLSAVDTRLAQSTTPNPVLAETLSRLRWQSQAALNSARAALADPVAARPGVLAETNALLTGIGSLLLDIERQRPPGDLPISRGDDLLRLSLQAARDRFTQTLQTFSTITTRTQAELVPYVENLRLSSADLSPWITPIQLQATDVALRARRAPGAPVSQDRSDSLYLRTQTALDSLDRAQTRIDAYLAAPQRSDRLAAAESALNDLQAQLANLLSTVPGLRDRLPSTAAAAFPMIWRHRDCAFLQTTSEAPGPWFRQGWSEDFFYQFSAPAWPPPNTLTVNGRGAYGLVVLAAGIPLSAQQRTRRQPADLFEGKNADPSRAGFALSPSPDFSAALPGTSFNDRLVWQ